jgi:hypothetical protein
MEHLDEGIIHTWLDGELSEHEASALEAHARSCEVCSELISEARGLTAASSRILRSLDEVPGNVVPLGVESLRRPSAVAGAEPGAPATGAQHRARRAWFRRPQFAAAAALVIVAAGTWRVTRDQSNATIADFAAPVVASEAPAATILDSSALSTATAAADQIAGSARNQVGQVAGAAKASGPVTSPAPSAKKAEGGATGRAVEREAAQPILEQPARERMTPAPTAADRAAERKASTDSAGKGASQQSSAARPESDSVRLARSMNSPIRLGEVVTTGASASSKTTSVRAELADSATRSEERRLRGENAAALGAARNGSLARRQNQAAAPVAEALRAASPVDAEVAQAAGCYDLASLKSTEASLPSRIRLNTFVAREEPLLWYAAQGYPGNTAPIQWVWRIVPASGIQLARVEGDRRVLTVMISGAPATTAARVPCP